jgi:hypothetical protein
MFFSFAGLKLSCCSESFVVTAAHQPGSSRSFAQPADMDGEFGSMHDCWIANELTAFDRRYDGRIWEQLLFAVVAPLLFFHCLSYEHP